MTDASQPPSNRNMQFGIATIADGLEAFGLKPFSEKHLEAIKARGLDAELLGMRGVGASPLLGGDAIGIPYFEDLKLVALKHRGLSEKRFTQDKGGKQVLLPKINRDTNEFVTKDGEILTTCMSQFNAACRLLMDSTLTSKLSESLLGIINDGGYDPMNDLVDEVSNPE